MMAGVDDVIEFRLFVPFHGDYVPEIPADFADTSGLLSAMLADPPRILTSQLVPEFDAIDWPFPTWRTTRRPFDWGEDQADLPHPPRGLLDDRRRWTFSLRPPTPVVRP